MRETNYAPAKELEKGRQVRKPGEDVCGPIADIEISETTAEGEGYERAEPGPAYFVGFAEQLK